MLVADSPGQHLLAVDVGPDVTRGTCSCGAWQRDAGPETLALTGRSREEALRASHELHTRGLTA